jgi:hypothetical protein
MVYPPPIYAGERCPVNSVCKKDDSILVIRHSFKNLLDVWTSLKRNLRKVLHVDPP